MKDLIKSLGALVVFGVILLAAAFIGTVAIYGGVRLGISLFK